MNGSHSRDRILSRLRQAPSAASRAPANPLSPVHGDPTRFRQLARDNHIHCEHCDEVTQGLQRIRQWMQEQELPSAPVVSGPLLSDARAAGWEPGPLSDLRRPHSVWINQSWCAVADTGTLVVLSRPEAPGYANFLAEHHWLLLDAGRILATKNDVWAQWRVEHDDTLLPAVHIISGPSRTADIEQTLQLGAHGPRSLNLMLVGR